MHGHVLDVLVAFAANRARTGTDATVDAGMPVDDAHRRWTHKCSIPFLGVGSDVAELDWWWRYAAFTARHASFPLPDAAADESGEWRPSTISTLQGSVFEEDVACELEPNGWGVRLDAELPRELTGEARVLLSARGARPS